MPNPEPQRSTTFKAERQITMYDQVLIDQESADEPGAPVAATASIELVAGGEFADKLASAIKRHGASGKSVVTWDFIWVKVIYQLILNRRNLQRHDVLEAYDNVPSGNLFGAAGSFHYANQDSYGVFIGICDELDLPLLGLEDRVFRVSVADAVWLIEQLCAGGYVLAMAESSM